MGTAILDGLLGKIAPNTATEIRYTACVRSAGSLTRLQNALREHQKRGTCQIANFVQASQEAEVVMLGVPPGELKSLLGIDGLSEALKGKTVISLLAGTSCDQILDTLTGDHDRDAFHILRVIPSLGARIHDSVSLIAKTLHAGEEQQRLCKWLFQQIGGTHHLPENLMNEATAAGAACHALAFIAVDAVVDASVAEGLPRCVAQALAAQSLRSAAGLLATGMTPESLKEAMSVPQGITINSALELERGQTRSGISDAVRHAIQYSRNMT